MSNNDKPLTPQEMGRLGGLARFKKYGKEGMASAGKKGAEGKLKKYGPDYWKNIRAVGVAKQKAKREEAERLANKKERGGFEVLKDFLTKGEV